MCVTRLLQICNFDLNIFLRLELSSLTVREASHSHTNMLHELFVLSLLRSYFVTGAEVVYVISTGCLICFNK